MLSQVKGHCSSSSIMSIGNIFFVYALNSNDMLTAIATGLVYLHLLLKSIATEIQ